ncbi:MAG: amidohydrolase [Saprospiraceae bacterium]|nr:amidohydrolase [Saprospiraceae bacterium]
MKGIYRHWYFLIISLGACTSSGPSPADLVIKNGTFATMSNLTNVQAIAIADGKIVAIGDTNALDLYESEKTKVLDAQGAFIMPGFIEAHGHFSGLGSKLQDLDFSGAENWDEIVNVVSIAAQKADKGHWIIGRGWHQEKWESAPERNLYGYPFHDELSTVSPSNPVLLYHASGHAVFANEAAMQQAGITLETIDPNGGAILRSREGRAIGVFEETAAALIGAAYERYLDTQSETQLLAKWKEGIELAQEECLTKGITSFYDAGSTLEIIERYRTFAESDQLDIRLWVMIRQSAQSLQSELGRFPWLGLGDNFLTVRAIKTAVDGALGSYGAWLLKPYHDKPDFVGQNTVPLQEVEALATMALKHDLQLCVHAIGDRANHETLNIFERYYALAGQPSDLRWRIEHAQHLHQQDIPRFNKIGVIAAMQGIHCTSDAPFVEKRLGFERSRVGAYPWRSLLDAGAIIANGTDAPVEDVDPIASFYASVTRKYPGRVEPFFAAQSMTRMEALRSYTLDAAYAGFEDHIKGSIETGKLADLTILDKNLLTCSEQEILQTHVLYTIVGGEIKYQLP